MSGWVEWRIDRSTNEIVGPCGCRLPNTFAGLMQARQHKHPAKELG